MSISLVISAAWTHSITLNHLTSCVSSRLVELSFDLKLARWELKRFSSAFLVISMPPYFSCVGELVAGLPGDTEIPSDVS